MAEASEQTGMAAGNPAGTGETAPARSVVYDADVKARIVRIILETGNQAEAARQVGGSSSGICKARITDPAFDQRVREARIGNLARRAQLPPPPLPPEPGPAERQAFDGSAEACTAFITLLAEHGGIKTAARAMGVTTASLYEVREQDADFRAAWDRAAFIYTQVAESELLRKVVDGGAGDVRAGALLVEKAKTALMSAKAAMAMASGPATRAEMEASRHELEGRLASLVERFGDPFGGGDASPGGVAA